MIKERLLYVDSLRGLCIILIVALHSKLTIINDDINLMLINMELPTFFFLSGLFFKRYGSFKEFFVKKVNHLVVPFVFFSYIPFCLFAYFYNDRYSDPIFYLAATIKPYNEPLWFVRSLFFTYLIYFVIDKYTERRSHWIQLLVIGIMVLVTWVIDIEYRKRLDVYPFLNDCLFIVKDVLTSIMVLPYFYLAQQIKKRGWLNFKFNWKRTILISSVALVMAYLLKQNHFGYYYAQYGDNILFQYMSSICSVIAFGVLFTKFKYTKLLQFFGRYSLIVLGCHLVPIIILDTNFWPPRYIVFVITFILMFPCIYFFKSYFPKFTAQEELFKSKS